MYTHELITLAKIFYLHGWNILPRKSICRVADQQARFTDGPGIKKDKNILAQPNIREHRIFHEIRPKQESQHILLVNAVLKDRRTTPVNCGRMMALDSK